VTLAGLEDEFDAALASDPELAANWSTVKVWTEGSRYQRNTKALATGLFKAVTDVKHGVLAWIEGRW
jgi:hypothetical protein